MNIMVKWLALLLLHQRFETLLGTAYPDSSSYGFPTCKDWDCNLE